MAVPFPARSRGSQLSSGTAFALLASISLALLAGSSVPTPLYPHYQAAWRFSPITTTLVFGVYSFAVLATLLVFGRLSDHVGRKPVLLVCTLLSALAMLVFATATGVGALFLGRIVQGLATGAAVGAVGAGLLDLDKSRGTVANALSPISGTALGGLVAGLLVHFLPYPTHLVFAAVGAIFLAQFGLLWLMDEPVSHKAGALASLRPRFAVPPTVRRPLLVSAPFLVAAWAFAGFYASLGPAMIRNIFGFDASLFGGIALFLMMGSAAVAIMVAMQREARAMLIAGSAALAVGTALVIHALSIVSPVEFFIGTAVAGLGFGAGFQGAMRMVVPLAAVHQRAGVLSVIWVISYFALALPAIGAGLAVARGAAILDAALYVGAAVLVLAVLALMGSLGSVGKKPA